MAILIEFNFCSDSATRITFTREQHQKLQKLLREKPEGQRRFTDQEIRKNASRLKIPAVKIRYWLKQRNALDDGPRKRVMLTTGEMSIGRSKLLNELSFDKKVFLLKKTQSATHVTVRLTQELSRVLQVDENRVQSWLKHKVVRNLKLRKSLCPAEIAALNVKFGEYDYLDDDTALVLADRFNVPSSVIKKAFQQRGKPQAPLKGLAKPVVVVKRIVPDTALVASVAAPPKGVRMRSRTKTAVSKKKPSFKTVDQKNALFEAFRQSPTLTRGESLAALVETTGLTSQQVVKWLSMFRAKWSQNNENGLKRALTRGLTQNQLVLLERAYRQDRFLTNAQLIELPKAVGMSMKTVQGWFSNRRVYEIRSCDKDLTNIGPKTVAARKESSQPLESQQPAAAVAAAGAAVPSEGDQADAEFFETLNREQKARLKAACRSYNVSYSRLAQSLGLPYEQVKRYVQNYRVRHSIIRLSSRALPERVHKALSNHLLKYGPISSKTRIVLAKRLKIRSEQIRTWAKTYSSRVLEAARASQRPSTAPQIAQPVYVEPVPVEQPAIKEECYEDTAVPVPKRRKSSSGTLAGKKYTVPPSAKAALLAEFIKSPHAPSARTRQLAHVVGLTQVQVRKWFYAFGKKLSEQTKSKVVACLNNPSISAEVRTELENVYGNRRYLNVPEMDKLAEKLGLARRQLESWFINARYYEVLFGRCPGSDEYATTTEPQHHVTSASNSFYEDLDDSQPQPSLNDQLDSHQLADEKVYESEKVAAASKTKQRRSSLSSRNVHFNFTCKMLQRLVSEYEANPILNETRAIALARSMKVGKHRIKAWFANRQQEHHQFVQVEDSDEQNLNKYKIPPIKITISKYRYSNDVDGDADADDVNSSKKSYVQQNRLLEEFKMDSMLTNERLLRISEDTGLDHKQISAWFDWIKAKLSSIPRESLLPENRNANLTAQQVVALEKEYAKNRYVDRSVRESLSRSLGVPRNVIKTWFANKRYSEILCPDELLDADPLSSHDDDDYDMGKDTGTDETVIDYEWDEESSVFDEPEQKFDVKRSLEMDPLLDYSLEEESDQDSKADIFRDIQLTSMSLFAEDLTSAPYQPRDRVFTRLGNDLEPLQGDVDEIFWFANKTPNKIDETFDREIDEDGNRTLESEFSKNPWADLDRISRLSAQLLVSQPKIHWWFIKKRCLMTKTILNLPAPKPKPKPPPKNVLIDLTEDDAMNDESQPPKCGEFEFVTLDETPQIKEEQLTEEVTALENGGDPFESEATDVQPSYDEELSRAVASINDIDTSTAAVSLTTDSTSPPVKKKKTKKIPLTIHQRTILRQEFKRNKIVSSSQARLLAQDLGLTVPRVEAWFENMRKKRKKRASALTALQSLSPEIENALETEYSQSAIFSDERTEAISAQLNVDKKIVKKWFIKRAKKVDGQMC